MPEEPKGRTRRLVYDAVRRFPGIHLRGIEQQLGTSSALASYHLKKLEADGWVESRQAGGYLRFFPTGKGDSVRIDPADMPWVGLLRAETPLHVVLILLDRGPRTPVEITQEVGGARTTVGYHIGKLQEAGVIERGDDGLLRLSDRERVYALLLSYHPTPDLTEAFGDLWEDLYGA